MRACVCGAESTSLTLCGIRFLWNFKSSQVKSSQIQNGGRQSAFFGAPRWRERSGVQNSAQPAPLDTSPESGHQRIIPIFLFLIIAVSTRRPRASTSCLFQEVYTVRQCNTAPGRRWERSGACASARVLLRWAEEMPVGSR